MLPRFTRRRRPRGCCSPQSPSPAVLTVFVVAAPLLTRGDAVGWQLILTVLIAGIAAIGLLSMLLRLRRELAFTREGFANQAAWAGRQNDEITALNAEITTLNAEIATYRKREQQRMFEFAELQDGHARQLEAQARSVTESVRCALLERIPAARPRHRSTAPTRPWPNCSNRA